MQKKNNKTPTKTSKATPIPKLEEHVIQMADDDDSFFRAVYLAVDKQQKAPLIDDVFVNVKRPFGKWLFMTSKEYDDEKGKKTNQIFLDDKEKMVRMERHIEEYKRTMSKKNDIYEFETNYNGKNKDNQIKLLIKKKDDHDVNVLVNDEGETYYPNKNPTFIVLQQDGGNHYNLVVTKKGRTYCKAYKQIGKLGCPLPPQYKDPLLKNLKEMNENKGSPELIQLIEHVEKGTSIVKSAYNPATKERIDEVAGTETPDGSDASSESNYSVESENVNGAWFNALIALPSFFDSIVSNSATSAKTDDTICGNEKYKSALNDVTPNTSGLLGGAPKSRFSKKRGALKKSAKRTKKHWKPR